MHGTRIYIAARFARRDELSEIARELERAGALVTSRWLFMDGASLDMSELRGEGRGARMAEMDLEDVRTADVCLAFTEPPGGPHGRGGRHTELGIAVALGRRVIVVGPREHVFHCLPAIEHFPDWTTARRSLGLVEPPSREPFAVPLAATG